MMQTPTHAERLERLYALVLRLYPERFRQVYTPQMRQTFRDALGDSMLPRRTLIPLLLRDLVTSLAKEHFAMLRDTFARPALLFNAVILAGISTVLAMALYSIPQQVLRQGLNDPQIAMAEDLTAALEAGTPPAAAIQAGSVDMARSLTPFLIAYDDQGRPLASQASLNGGVPVPPKGVFDYVRERGEERVSWQPILGNVRGVRIAAVVRRVNGSHPGFVLAGRNMREVETREEQVEHMAGLAWLAMLGLIVVGTAVFGWYTRPKAA
jgi:hypothetical protein